MVGLAGESLNLTDYNLNKMKEIFPEVFYEGKIDFDKLRLILGDNIEDKEERYEFTWNGKNDAIRIAQTPSTGTLRPDKESSKSWDNTENLYIEGDNLEVLKLLQKSYFGKIKMIYIDPPYNTGKDFVYKDNFRDNIANYKEITNQTTKANPETNGRYHTDWLNMMYPRLKLARNLLREDGVIFISINDVEVDNLRKICNENFGEENYIASIIWEKKSSPQNDSKWISDTHDYILCYSKNKNLWHPKKLRRTDEQNKIYNKSDLYDGIKNGKIYGRGPWFPGDLTARRSNDTALFEIVTPSGKKVIPAKGRGWSCSQERFKELLADNRITFGEKGENKPCIKRFLSEIIDDGVVPKTSWSYKDVGENRNGRQEIKSIFDNNGVFDSPKPSLLIKRIIEISNLNKDSIVLDFFSGSGTTSDSLFKYNIENNMNCNFILVQLPENISEKSEAYKAGYKNICEIGKERIRRVGDKIVSENKNIEGIENLDIGFKVFKLDSSNLKSWDSSIENLEQNLLEMDTNLKKDRSSEDLLYEILLKSGVELTAKIEEIKVGYNTLYNIGCGALLVCLDDKITQDVIDEIPKHKSPFMETKVIFKESGFMSDSAKINAIQNLKQFKIEDVRSV